MKRFNVFLLFTAAVFMAADAHGFFDGPLDDPLLVRAALLAEWLDPDAYVDGCSPLMRAKNAGVTWVLLEAGANPRFRARDGKTPLHYAPDAKSARLLLAAGANVAAQDKIRLTPLHCARDAGVARVLLEAGANVKLRARKELPDGRYGMETPWVTPLAALVVLDIPRVEPAAIARVLLDADPEANVNVSGSDGRTLLMYARTPEMVALLLEAGADADDLDRDGWSVLDYVTDPECVKLLLAAGANPDEKHEEAPPAAEPDDDPSPAARELARASEAEETPPPSFEEAERFVFTLRGFSDGFFRGDWIPLDDPLLVRAMMLVGKRVEDCMPADFLPLFAARNPAVAREMLAAGMPVDMRGPNHETALFHVRDVETARVLLDAGADVNAVDENDHTALWRAAHGDIVELLLARGVRLSADDDESGNILETAADAKAVRLLVAAGADAKAQTEFSSPLMTAKNAGVVRALLEAGADARYKDNHGKTPLHVAPDTESARLLIAAGADVNGRYQPSSGAFAILEDDSPPLPLTPLAEVVEELQYPSSFKQPEEKIRIARLLIAAGADVNVKSKYGENLLDKVRNPELMKLLLDAGADVNARNRDGQTPLMKADNEECAKLLIAAGADIHARDDEGCTPLLHAGNTELMKLLLDAGADVNAKDKKGRTSISYVGRGEHVRLLLAAGANAEDLWRWGNPLFHVLDVEAATLVIELLRAGGQDVKKLVNEQDEKGNTPLMLAVEERGMGLFAYQFFKDAVPELDLPDWKYRWMIEDEGVQGTLRKMQSQGMLGLVRAFVAAGADGNIANEEGEIPLFYARKPETVRLLLKAGVPSQEKLDTALFRVIGNNAPSESVGVLLEAGANANARGELGWSPLLLLAVASSGLSSDIPAITRLLVEAGADVDIQPYWKGDEEYDWMAYSGGHSGKQEPNCFSALHMMRDWEAVQVLLDAGADIETWTPEQSTPLHTRGDCPLVVRTLIAAGADVNARNEGWQTPLFYACDSRSVRLLVAAGADVNARDDEDRTPLFDHVSEQWAGYDVVQTLIALGADVNARDEEGNSVLSQVHEYDWETREKLIAAGAEE